MTQRERIAQELAQMELFDATFGDEVGHAISTLTDLMKDAELKADSKAVGAYKRKRVKRYNTILNRAVNDLTKMLESGDEDEDSDATDGDNE